MRQDYRPAPLHRKISDALERVERGECKRLMMFVPPRHGKSMLTSEHFPAWCLGRDPSRFVVCATYGQDLADDFGRKVRGQMLDPLYAETFPGCTVDPDSASVSRISTQQNGSYFAVGIGGALTGRGANILVVDDPHKDRADADSTIMRKRAKDWFQAVAYTRLMPDGAIVVMQCMTGDTPVLLPDGTEKRLDAVRTGDVVASHDNGLLVAARVVGWKSSGRDLVYKITMSSGRVVRANGRHPFLVSDGGELKWIRTRSLTTDSRIVAVRGSGASGAGKPALRMGATVPLSAGDTALHTTVRKNGPMDRARRHAIQSPIGRRILKAVTGLRQSSSIPSWLRKAGNALYAALAQCRSIGAAVFALTTATKPAGFAACYATAAIFLPDTSEQKAPRSLWPSTCEFGVDRVVSVEPAGEEEVFDVQIAGTENFIANGLVSHNTRWHEDDLAGWLLREHGDEGWEILNVPAIPPPWPEAFPLEKLDKIKRMLGSRDWSALYMQSPVPGGGGEFKREWLRHYDSTPDQAGKGTNKYILVDPAGEKRPGNDFTSIWVVGLGGDGNYYWLDGVRDRLNLPERGRAVLRLHRKWKPVGVRYERYGMMGDIQYLRELQERENYRFAVTEVAGPLKKEDRIRRLLPMMEQGKFYAPQSMHQTDSEGNVRDLVQIFIEEEMAAFPAGLHDDMLDGLARIAEPDLPLLWPREGSQIDLSLFKPRGIGIG